MVAFNTLELARQGDPAAIATILSYHLIRRYHTVASVIRLGDYLSVFVTTPVAIARDPLIQLIQSTLQNLNIDGIATLEICAQVQGDRTVIWSQTIALAPLLPATMPDSNINPDQAETTAIDGSNAIASTTGTAAYPPDPVPDLASPLPPLATQANPPEFTLQTLLTRPEMVAMVAMALMLVFWDAYLDWMDETDLSKPFSIGKLARRLGVRTSTLKRYKQRPNFASWSQDLDPDGIPWEYHDPTFVPRLG